MSTPRPSTDAELVARRDRLVERFAVMQTQLGGLYYEMAIRDHVQPHVLARKAAELQRVDMELAQVEKLLQTGDAGAAGDCPGCGAPYGHADAFCSQCGHVLQPHAEIAAP